VAANQAGPVATAVNPPPKLSTSQAGAGPQALAAAVLLTREDATMPPPPPNLYLEVAGLGPRQDANFVKELEAKGYQARIQTVAPNLEDGRILIGPFVGRSSLEKAELKLQSTGVLAMEVTY
jgi:cell division septation protein DedD